MRETLDPATSLGAVRLTVADLERVQDFYEQALGLRRLARAGDVVELGPDAEPLVALVGDEEAPPRPGRSTGLFHLALLVPTRADLAQAMRRVLQAGRSFTGAADHLVSEALYLEDPEGNGVEIYRDRPREEWRYQNGRLAMATEPLDLEGLMAELPHEGEDLGMPAGTKIGHVHLQVADLAAAEAFYSTLLGFEVSVRGYPGALFVSAGGYHHHIGLNTWAGEGAPAPPPGSRGLRWFEVVLPSAAELGRVSDRLAAAGLQARSQERGLLVSDPSGNLVLLASGPQPRVDSTR
jgi:catechol 2,3-dioxygenase